MENIDIIALPQFEKEILQLSKKYPSIEKDFANLLEELTNNPFSGNSLGHSCYKVRMKLLPNNRVKVEVQGLLLV